MRTRGMYFKSEKEYTDARGKRLTEILRAYMFPAALKE